MVRDGSHVLTVDAAVTTMKTLEGENDPSIWKCLCAGLGRMGIVLVAQRAIGVGGVRDEAGGRWPVSSTPLEFSAA